MINTKRPNTDDYTQVGFIEAKDGQGNYQNIDHIYDSEGNIVFQQGYLNEYDGADDFGIPAIGKPLIDYIIYGNAFQDGIPTSGNPIMPQGTGERTGNLYGDTDISGTINNTYYKNDFVYANLSQGTYTLAFDLETTATSEYRSSIGVGATTFSKDIQTQKGKTDGHFVFTFTISEEDAGKNLYARYARFSTAVTVTYTASNIMLNTGTTALPYEPYGYKIPISSANTTTPVYLGEVQTTRKIRKLVLTGEENWKIWAMPSGSSTQRFFINISEVDSYLSLCSHFIREDGNKDVTHFRLGGGNYNELVFFINNNISTVADFKSFLQQQYANGTPVTVWYVLATEETAVVNEPLMRIGGYVDTLSMEQAGVEIPTLKRPNTTEIDITTSLPPSEVYAKYRGSKTQKYDLFLAANGDSFEAKNGQSLYIGDDT